MRLSLAWLANSTFKACLENHSILKWNIFNSRDMYMCPVSSVHIDVYRCVSICHGMLKMEIVHRSLESLLELIHKDTWWRFIPGALSSHFIWTNTCSKSYTVWITLVIMYVSAGMVILFNCQKDLLPQVKTLKIIYWQC